VSSIPVWYGVVSLVVPTGTGLLGYLLSGRNNEARDRRAAEREQQAARQLERETTRDAWTQAFYKINYRLSSGSPPRRSWRTSGH